MKMLNEFKNANEYIMHVRECRKNDEYVEHVVDVVENLQCHVCKSHVELIDEFDNRDELRTIVARVKLYRCTSCTHEIEIDFDKYDCVIC